MKSAERDDALTTLAIAALLHESNESVVRCAVRLKQFVERRVVKSLLDPLIRSESARQIVLDNTVDKVRKLHVGTALYLGVEYDILVHCQGKLRYETSEVVHGVVTYLTKMGAPHGEVGIDIVHSYWRQLRRGIVRYSSGVHSIAIDYKMLDTQT